MSDPTPDTSFDLELKRVFYKWDSNPFPSIVLGSDIYGTPVTLDETGCDFFYEEDVAIDFQRRYTMDDAGIYQIHYKINRVDVTDPDSGFTRKWRFTKATSTSNVQGYLYNPYTSSFVYQSELASGSLGVEIDSRIYNSKGLDLSYLYGGPIVEPWRPEPGTYELKEYLYTEDPDTHLLTEQAHNTLQTFDVRGIRVQNFESSRDSINPCSEDDEETFTTLTGDIITLPVSSTLAPSGWTPDNLGVWIGTPDSSGYLPSVEVHSPSSTGVVYSFSVNWTGFADRGALHGVPFPSPVEGTISIAASSTARISNTTGFDDACSSIPGPLVYVRVERRKCKCNAWRCLMAQMMRHQSLGSPYGPYVDLGMSYSSDRREHAPASMGYGWSSLEALRVEEKENGDLVYHGADQDLIWHPVAGTYYKIYEDNYVLAEKNEEDTETPYRLTFPDQTKQFFGPDGKIVYEADTRDQRKTYSYLDDQLYEVTDASGRFYRYLYGDRTDGQPVQIEAFHPQDTDTPVKTIDYDYYADDDLVSPNRLMSVTADGITTSFSYDENGALASVTTPQSTVVYTYDDLGRVVSEAMSGGGESPELQSLRLTLYSADSTEVRVAEWDKFSAEDQDLPRLSVMRLDERSNITSQSELIADTSEIDETLTTSELATFNVTTMLYEDHSWLGLDQRNPYLLTTRQDPNGALTNFRYNLRGQMTSVTDAQGNATTYSYGFDLFGPTHPFPDHLYGIQRSPVTVNGETVEYDPIQFGYDEYGTLNSIQDSLGHQTTMELNEKGQVISITDRLSRVTTFGYGLYGNLESVTIPSGLPGDTETTRTYLFGYDNLDNLTTVTDPLGNTWTTEYDDASRPIRTEDPSGQEVFMTYLEGLLQTIEGPPNQGSDTNRRQTSLSYDSAGRMNRVDADVSTSEQVMRVRYEFTGFSTLHKLVRLMGETEKSTSYQRDRLGRTTSVKDPLDRETTIEHAPFCTQHTVTTARGILRQYSYDTLCQLTEVKLGTSLETPDETREYFYDELGRLTKVRQKWATGSDLYGVARYGSEHYAGSQEDRLFEYDPLDRLTKVTFPDGKTIRYQYDVESNLTRMVDVSGAVTEYTYYNDNRLYQVRLKKPAQADRVFEYEYDEAGRLKEIRYPSSTGISARFSDPLGNPGWDSNGRLTYLRYVKDDTHLHSFAYSYDAAGNRTQLVDTPTDTSQVQTWDYGYDWLNRLSSVTLDGTLHTVYGYDESDNRVSIEWPTLEELYTFDLDAADQLVRSYLNDVENEDFTYDEDGNLTSRTPYGEMSGTTYTWNADDRLVAITKPDTSTERHSYDADGIRKRKSDGATTRFFSTDKSLYDVRPTGPIAYIQGHQLLGYVTGGAYYYFVPDGLSSVRQVVDSNGNSVASFDHEAFGEPRDYDTTGGGDDAHTYVGALGVRNENAFAGLYYMRQRWYDPSLGRFLSRDPIGVRGGLNLYSYARNSPAGLSDWSGLVPMDDNQNQALADALGVLSRTPGYQANAAQIKAALATGKIWIDPTVGQGSGEANAMAVTNYPSAGYVRLHPALCDLSLGSRMKGAKMERLKRAVRLASILLHEYGHVLSPGKSYGFERPRYEEERQFLKAVLQTETCGSDRYTAVYEVGIEREDQGYNQGFYGGNLSGTRLFPAPAPSPSPSP